MSTNPDRMFLVCMVRADSRVKFVLPPESEATIHLIMIDVDAPKAMKELETVLERARTGVPVSPSEALS